MLVKGLQNERVEKGTRNPSNKIETTHTGRTGEVAVPYKELNVMSVRLLLQQVE